MKVKCNNDDDIHSFYATSFMLILHIFF